MRRSEMYRLRWVSVDSRREPQGRAREEVTKPEGTAVTTKRPGPQGGGAQGVGGGAERRMAIGEIGLRTDQVQTVEEGLPNQNRTW